MCGGARGELEKTNRISKIQVLVEQLGWRRQAGERLLTFRCLLVGGQSGRPEEQHTHSLNVVTEFLDLNTKLD